MIWPLVVIFGLAVINLGWYAISGRAINLFTAGFCCGMGISVILAEIMDRRGL